MKSSHFPQDVINDILVSLPVKSLLRFKSVSKPWQSLIKSTHFVKSHLNLSTQTRSNKNLILAGGDVWSVEFDSLRQARRIDCPFKDPKNGTTLIGSCNGLLCLVKSEQNVAFWNPSTRALHVLPSSSVELDPNFNLFESFFSFGFAYDPFNDDYKFLMMVLFFGHGPVTETDCEVKLYSLKTNSWKKVNDVSYYVPILCDPDLTFAQKTRHALSVAGALNWVTNGLYCNREFVIAFDLKDEKFHHVQQPKYGHDDYHLNAGVLDGKFCIMCNYSKNHVDVWVMMEYRVPESWMKLFSFVNDRPQHLTPLAYSKIGDKILLEQDRKKLIWYDLKSKSLEMVEVRGAPRTFGVEMCQESLVCPN